MSGSSRGEKDRRTGGYSGTLADPSSKPRSARTATTARPSSAITSSTFRASTSVPQSLNAVGVETVKDSRHMGMRHAVSSTSSSRQSPTLEAPVRDRQRTLLRSTTMDSVNNNPSREPSVNSNTSRNSNTDSFVSSRTERDRDDGPFVNKTSPRSSFGSNKSSNPFNFALESQRKASITSGQNNMAKLIKMLHSKMFESELSEEEIQDCISFLEDENNIGKHKINDARVAEKLKIHLIHQGRDKDAMQFVALFQRFRKTKFFKRKEDILQLFYMLFDKHLTRLALANIRQSETPTNGNDQPVSSNAEEAVMPGSPSRAAVTGVKAAVANYGDKLMNLQNSPNSNAKVSPFLSSNTGGQRKSDLVERPNPNVTLRSSGRHDPKSELFSSTNPRLSDFDSVDYGSVNDGFPGKSKDPSSRCPDSSEEYEPVPVPRFERSVDEKTRDLIHKSTNRITPLSTNAAESVFEPPASSTQCKLISFPPNHGRNLLSSPSTSSSINTGFSRYSQESVSAPLTSSKTIPFLRNQNSAHTRPFSNQGALEKDLIKDLVYIFQGINGNALQVKPDEKYELMGMNSLHPSLRMQTLRLCELGYSYKKIKKWCDKPTTELMTLGFKYSLEKELHEFYRLLAVIQATIQPASVDTPLRDEFNAGEDLTMSKLTLWVYDCRVRLDVLASLIESADNKKGGELCSILYRYTLHGDPMISSACISLLSNTAKPMYVMLCQWILYGELEDPSNEFFIAADKDCKMEHLWHSMYRIRRKMLPSFISNASAERILATGKNINFLKYICQNNKGYPGREEIKKLLETTPVECIFLEDDIILKQAIESAYTTTSEMVLNVLLHDARLLDHLKAIKHYLLLGQGDFIQYLLELLQDELNKSASKIFSHNLSTILDSAIRATNAQFEDEEILSRLDTRILLGNDSDLGWDVFCLDYKSHGPIGTVLTEDVINSYNKLFNTLWRTKRIEAMLSRLWKNQTTLFKCQKVIPELGAVLHRSQLLISEMIHFVHQTQYYIMFEATECAWDFMMDKVLKAKDLDEVIKAHADFIGTIAKRSLLDISKRELLGQLRGIFGYVHELKDFLTKFDEIVVVELRRRKSRNVVLLEADANKDFFTKHVTHAKAKIEALYVRTQDMIRSFILSLNNLQDSDSMTLQCLSFRLDFNEYYATKDSRLSFPLTFQHRRLSSNAFSPGASLCASGTGLNSLTASGIFGASVSISEVMFEDE